MGKTVGYFEGTDPQLLNSLAIRGVGTVPLSNGFDFHGKPVGYLAGGNGIDLVVGYFYKVVPPREMSLAPDESSVLLKDILSSCVTNDIPVLLIVSESLHDDAKQVAGGIPAGIKLVSPERAVDEVLRIIGS